MVEYLNSEFVANLLPSRILKNFENRIIVGEVMAKNLMWCFLAQGVELELDCLCQLINYR